MPVDRVISAEHGWLAPLSLEEASTILFRNTDHAPELAVAQRVSARHLLNLEIVDHFVSEPVDPAETPEVFCRRPAHGLKYEIAAPMRQDETGRLDARLARYDRLG